MNIRHTFMAAVLSLGLMASMASVAVATPVTINPATTAAVLTGNQTSQALIDVAIAGTLGTAVELYKQDVGVASDTGSLAGSYTTTFSNSPTDPEDALIVYNPTGNVAGPTAYLLVKDGNSSPAWYLYNLTLLGWTGTENVTLEDFWPSQGAISHVTLYGNTGGVPPSQVPEPATLLLLGVGLSALGVSMRKRLQ